jgi:hypothetical protein
MEANWRPKAKLRRIFSSTPLLAKSCPSPAALFRQYLHSKVLVQTIEDAHHDAHTPSSIVVLFLLRSILPHLCQVCRHLGFLPLVPLSYIDADMAVAAW